MIKRSGLGAVNLAPAVTIRVPLHKLLKLFVPWIPHL